VYRLLHFSGPQGEYVVLTDEMDADANDWLVTGYQLKADLEFTPEAPNLWYVLPLNYQLHRRD